MIKKSVKIGSVIKTIIKDKDGNIVDVITEKDKCFLPNFARFIRSCVFGVDTDGYRRDGRKVTIRSYLSNGSYSGRWLYTCYLSNLLVGSDNPPNEIETYELYNVLNNIIYSDINITDIQSDENKYYLIISRTIQNPDQTQSLDIGEFGVYFNNNGNEYLVYRHAYSEKITLEPQHSMEIQFMPYVSKVSGLTANFYKVLLSMFYPADRTVKVRKMTDDYPYYQDIDYSHNRYCSRCNIYTSCNANENDDSFGVIVGKSDSTPVSEDNFKLDDPYTKDEVTYWKTTVLEPYIQDQNNSKIIHVKLIRKISWKNQDATVKEAGLIADYIGNKILLARITDNKTITSDKVYVFEFDISVLFS